MLKIFSAMLIAALILIPSAAYAEEVQKFVLGISPASQAVCLAAGGADTLRFMISTNVDVPQNISVDFMGQNWAKAEKYLYFSSTQDIFVDVSVPKGVQDGMNRINMLVCRLSEEGTNETMDSTACISPYIDINVTEACASNGRKVQPADNGKYLWYAALIPAIALVVRQAGKIMRHGKAKRHKKQA